VQIVAELPINASGKVLKNELRELAKALSIESANTQ